MFCKTIGVSALPLVKMYTSSGEVESFPCGPKKIELLRAKLDEWAVKLDTSVAPPAVADEISSGSPDNMSMQQQEQQAAAKLAATATPRQSDRSRLAAALGATLDGEGRRGQDSLTPTDFLTDPAAKSTISLNATESVVTEDTNSGVAPANPAAVSYSYNVKADVFMKNGYYSSTLQNGNDGGEGSAPAGGGGRGAFAVDLRRISGRTLQKTCGVLFGHLDSAALVSLVSGSKGSRFVAALTRSR